MNHNEKHVLANKKVKIEKGQLAGNEIVIEDWWDRVYGKSWMFEQGNPACLQYAIRTGLQEHRVPSDDEVIYGKIGNLGHLVHVSELSDATSTI